MPCCHLPHLSRHTAMPSPLACGTMWSILLPIKKQLGRCFARTWLCSPAWCSSLLRMWLALACRVSKLLSHICPFPSASCYCCCCCCSCCCACWLTELLLQLLLLLSLLLLLLIAQTLASFFP